MTTIDDRINTLRRIMIEFGLDAYLIPSSDPHQSENVSAHWKSRVWISGFTGSAGMIVVTKNHAGLWTDSRYFLQAEKELAGTQIKLHKQGVPHAPEHNEWLRDNLPTEAIIGVDANLFSLGQLNRMQKVVEQKGIKLNTQHDLIEKIWKDRPSLPNAPIFEHEVKFAGRSRKKKIAAIREKMEEYGASYHLLTTLDDIAWTFNIRGTDVEYSPLAVAFAVIAKEINYLFIDPQKIPVSLRKRFDTQSIVIKPYTGITQFLSELPIGKILIDQTTINYYLHSLIDKKKIIYGPTIPMALKAIKNKTEIAHIKETMQKDGVALVRLYRWLEEELKTRTVSECELAEKLASYRSEQGLYHGESFAAIVGYNANGAIVHYRPMPETCALIKKSGILLLDSGGQYENGTTDITRTISLGTPNKEQKEHFTLVLKGYIAIDTLVFPKGTKGIQLDAFARQALWKHRLNYGHGTGHGVGFFLNVREPPQGFAISISASGSTPFEAGMVTSNEPGFYKDGAYGIRTENLLLTVEDEKNAYGSFLRFETLTLFPIDKNLIDLELLDRAEIAWLNQYHQKVEEKLSPLLTEEEQKWLKKKCSQSIEKEVKK